MPSGCEFICKNAECHHVDKGFVITAPWPLGRIELIINLPRVKKKEEFRNGLILLKNQGRTHACITFPNDNDIPYEGYRVSYWSPEDKRVWQYDVMVKDLGDVSEAIKNDPDIPKKCPNTGGKLLSFVEAVKEGVNCPSCGVKMIQSRWFTNER